MLPVYKSELSSEYGPAGAALSGYIGHTSSDNNQITHFTPIGALISYLWERLAWEDPFLRDLADYYRVTEIGGIGTAEPRPWPSSIYSEEVRYRAEAGRLTTGRAAIWDEWNMAFCFG